MPVSAVAARETIDMSDVRVVERSERLRFLLEARDAHRVVRERRGQHLDRDVATELRIARAIDLAHAARADRLDDFIRPEPRAERDRHLPTPRRSIGRLFSPAGLYRTRVRFGSVAAGRASLHRLRARSRLGVDSGRSLRSRTLAIDRTAFGRLRSLVFIHHRPLQPVVAHKGDF